MVDESHDKHELTDIGHSRREALRLGGIAAVTAAAGGLVPAMARATETASGEPPFEIVFTIFPKGTLLDFAGPNEVFSRIPNTKIRFASPAGGPVTLENGVIFGESEKLSDVSHADLLCVPGGPDLSAMMRPEVLAQVRRLADGAKYVTSVCTGSIVLAATGVLKGKRSACHWASLNVLKQYGAIPDPARIVKDGRFMSGGGVTAGIDFALAAAAEIRGKAAAEVAQLIIQYDPQPPFRAGHPSVAPHRIRDLVYSEIPGAAQGLFRPFA